MDKFGELKDGVFIVPKNGKLRVGCHDIDFNVIQGNKVSFTAYDFFKFYYEPSYSKSHTRVIRNGKIKFNTYIYDISEANIHKLKG